MPALLSAFVSQSEARSRNFFSYRPIFSSIRKFRRARQTILLVGVNDRDAGWPFLVVELQLTVGHARRSFRQRLGKPPTTNPCTTVLDFPGIIEHEDSLMVTELVATGYFFSDARNHEAFEVLCLAPALGSNKRERLSR